METVVEETSLHLCGAFVQSTNQNPADHKRQTEDETVSVPRPHVKIKEGSGCQTGLWTAGMHKIASSKELSNACVCL